MELYLRKLRNGMMFLLFAAMSFDWFTDLFNYEMVIRVRIVIGIIACVLAIFAFKGQLEGRG